MPEIGGPEGGVPRSRHGHGARGPQPPAWTVNIGNPGAIWPLPGQNPAGPTHDPRERATPGHPARARRTQQYPPGGPAPAHRWPWRRRPATRHRLWQLRMHPGQPCTRHLRHLAVRTVQLSVGGLVTGTVLAAFLHTPPGGGTVPAGTPASPTGSHALPPAVPTGSPSPQNALAMNFSSPRPLVTRVNGVRFILYGGSPASGGGLSGTGAIGELVGPNEVPIVRSDPGAGPITLTSVSGNVVSFTSAKGGHGEMYVDSGLFVNTPSAIPTTQPGSAPFLSSGGKSFTVQVAPGRFDVVTGGTVAGGSAACIAVTPYDRNGQQLGATEIHRITTTPGPGGAPVNGSVFVDKADAFGNVYFTVNPAGAPPVQGIFNVPSGTFGGRGA